MKPHVTILCIALIGFISTRVSGQQKINLVHAHQQNRIKAVNRSISSLTKYADAVEMDARESDGLGILKELEFEKGTIEIELQGENSPGRSFIGIAFNIQDKDTYEVVYFRPFNFVAEEQVRKEHMVQYVFHPVYTWKTLREERTGVFENEIPDPPDPDGWFKTVIKISEKQVKVFMREGSQPVLEIDRLSEMKSPEIALWTGYGSSGRFRNLVLLKE